MTSYHAYIDETGDHSLNTVKTGTSKYFIILAIIIKESAVDDLDSHITKIRNKYYGGSEIKSSTTKDDRRSEIFNELFLKDFKYYALVIKKENVNKESGLIYKKPFIKATNRIIYSSLVQHFPKIKIFADGHGGNEFIESFKKYITKNIESDLFVEPKIEIVNSKNKNLVQLADLIAGTVNKKYQNIISEKYEKQFVDFLKLKEARTDEWPPRFTNYELINDSNVEFDKIVYQTALDFASKFLIKHSESGDNEIRMQYEVLSYLLFNSKYTDDDEYISTGELITHLRELGYLDINIQAFRSNIVSKLRDNNILIASSTRGYKIPTCYSDIIGFANLVDGIVIPLLSRLNRANDTLKLASNGKMNFLNEPRFAKLQNILNDFDK